MFRNTREARARASKELRGTILTLLYIALIEEINPSDPHSLPGATLVDIIRSHSSFGTSNMAELRGALRYLAEKGYVEVEWIPETGDFSRVRICAKGVDLVEAEGGLDPGVILRGKR